MKKWKIWCIVILIVAVVAGAGFCGVVEYRNHAEETRRYQEAIDSLAAENESLRGREDAVSAQEQSEASGSEETDGQGAEETESSLSQETGDLDGAEGQDSPSGEEGTDGQLSGNGQASGGDQASGKGSGEGQSTVSGNGQQVSAEGKSGSWKQEMTAESEKALPEDALRILVFGDSTWGSVRDATGVGARVEQYMSWEGQSAKVYNAAIGGSRATVDAKDVSTEYGPGTENSLAKMCSVLVGETDVEWMRGSLAYEDLKDALARKEELDYVILSYGLNDFLNQVPLNTSNMDLLWTGYGTALTEAVKQIRAACPNAQVMICAPAFASYFPIAINNSGEKSLSNYASVACDVGKGSGALCMDAYHMMGIDPYNADIYLEDGMHLSEEGRDLYARSVVNCLLNGQPGVVSGNALVFD